MKRLIIIICIIFTLAIISIFAIHYKVANNFQKKNKTSVAVLMNGPRDDNSWNESHYVAIEKTAKELNLEVAYYENIFNDSTARAIIQKVIENGAKIIIANSFEFGTIEYELANKNPDVKFFYTSGDKPATNLTTFFGRIYQMRYLCGLIAGKMTKTGEIGYIASFNIPEIVRGIDAFALGVKKVNPKAKIFVSWSNSWTDENMAIDATNDLLKKHHIDIITAHTNTISQYEIANEKNIWILGYNKDLSKMFPKNFLTAPIWHWEKFYIPIIREVLEKRYKSYHFWLGLESDWFDLSPMTKNVSDSVQHLVETEKAYLRNGGIDIFYGPIIDNKGIIRVNKGEYLPDNILINNLDWFVDGVVDGLKK